MDSICVFKLLVKGGTLTRSVKTSDNALHSQILKDCKHIAGSCEIRAIYICKSYSLGGSNGKVPLEVFVIIRAFQPKLVNYVKNFSQRNIIFFGVDQWVFERDVDRGFLGEALSGELLLPYIPLTGKKYLFSQEVKLKKRLIKEILESLVTDFPELSYEMHIKVEYFMYELLWSRTRIFPPLIYTLLNFNLKSEENKRALLSGYLEALKELEKEKIVNFSNDFIRIEKDYIARFRRQKIRFTNLFRTAQRTLFMSLLKIFPRIMSFLYESKDFRFMLQKVATGNSEIANQIEDPKKYLLIPTTRGLVPLANRMDIKAFAKKALCVNKEAKIVLEEIGGILNDVYLIRTFMKGEERKIVVKNFRDLSSLKWFPLTLWTVGTRSFAVSGRSRLEREYAINQFLSSKGLAVPKIVHVSHANRLIFMEYVEGENLEKIVKRIVNSKEVQELKKDLGLIKRVGEKFATIHTLGVALGDTKPENIMVSKNGEIYILDFEQASRNGDKIWDIAEFLYYAGHYTPPLATSQVVELIAKTFIEGYLKAGGNIEFVKKAGRPKYTKVFSVFTFPHIIYIISNVCKKADKLKG